LSRMLATLVDEHGAAAFDGLLDDLPEPRAAERARLAALPFDDARFRAVYGLRPGVELAGDPSIPVYEGWWLRRSVTVSGLDGHPIAGSSNQIVSDAAARVSVRIAPGQDPARVLAALDAHLRARVPWGLECAFEPHTAVRGWRCEPEGWA